MVTAFDRVYYFLDNNVNERYKINKEYHLLISNRKLAPTEEQ